MECPYCKYTIDDNGKDREAGQFWKLTNDVQLERDTYLFEKQTAKIYGCPQCKLIFVCDYTW
jgi:hypothetical protein